jgi:hypothetical protein
MRVLFVPGELIGTDIGYRLYKKAADVRLPLKMRAGKINWTIW